MSNLTFWYNNGIFDCEYRQASYIPTSFRDECVRAAKIIHDESHELTPTVMLSGGLDSEVVVKSFIEAKVPFEILTFRYPSGANEHELQNVRRFCAENNLEPKYYDIDIESWATSDEATKMFFDSQCTFFEMVPHMKLMNEIRDRGGMPILGNGEVLLKNIRQQWYYVEYEYDVSWYKHAIQNQIVSVPGFFQLTPEIMLAALLDKRNAALGSGSDVLANKLLENSRHVKYKMYMDHFPELHHRQKFDGGENLRPLFKGLDRRFRSDYRDQFNSKFLVPYADFVQQLMPNSKTH